MCGIAGTVAFKGLSSTSEIETITNLARHRGPDDFGYLGFSSTKQTSVFTQNVKQFEHGEFDVFLGHRRLSILDLSESGRCPMSYADGRLWITYNGEIYNYLELREELSGLGYQFRTHTDTEIILAAYLEWGIDCQKRFNGMWAFAILDVQQMILFCSRDRLGVKPFYYHYDGALFSFASEIKQLLALERVDKAYNAGELFDFFTFSTYGCNSERTFYRDIFDLRGGHYLIVNLAERGGWAPTPIQWWDIDLSNKTLGLSDTEYANRYRDLLEDAVKLRLRSDVPLGTCLSGGLDSSGIVCMVDKLFHQSGIRDLQKTFTSVSDNPALDERDFAQAVIDATQVEPFFVLPSAERLVQDLDRLIWHQDEPFLSTSIFAGWCVYDLAHQNGVKVTLDGQGPDEMLCGYVPYMYKSAVCDNVKSLALGEGLANLRGVHRTLGISYSKMAVDLLSEIGRGVLPISLMPSIGKAREIFHTDFFEQGMEQSNFLHKRANLSCVEGNHLDRLLYNATRFDTLPGILRQVDRNSMAFSIESRLPFLDYRLVEYTFSLPNQQKILGGVAKQVYRRAITGLVPSKISERTSKFGFVTAEADWIRGHAKQAFNEVYSEIGSNSPYSKHYVQSLFDRFNNQQAAFDPMLWKTFCTERWLNKDKQN